MGQSIFNYNKVVLSTPPKNKDELLVCDCTEKLMNLFINHMAMSILVAQIQNRMSLYLI